MNVRLPWGGMGSVFKARDQKLDRLVAIKLPRPEITADEEGRERFFREARSAARLRHANICPIYKIGESESQPYIAMGFIEGATLREKAKQQKPSPREAAEVIAKLAHAVGFAYKLRCHSPRYQASQRRARRGIRRTSCDRLWPGQAINRRRYSHDSNRIPHLNFVTGATISPDSKRLALVTYSEIHIIDLATDDPLASLAELKPKTIEYEAGMVESVCWDGNHLLMLSEDGTLYRIDPEAQ